MPCYLSCICLIDTQSIAVVLAIAAGITLMSYGMPCGKLANSVTLPPGATIFSIGISSLDRAILYPSFEKNFPNTKYQVGNTSVSILSGATERQFNSVPVRRADNLPTFFSSILVGREYAIPYHLGYYRQFRQRMLALIRAQYSLDLVAVQTLIQSMV